MRVRTLLNPFSCPHRFIKQQWSDIFQGFQNQLDVEIGFGTGSFIETYAKANPTRLLVGFEIRTKLVAAAQEKMKEQLINNTHLVWGNGYFGLEDMFEDHSIDRLFIFHPDPWYKKSHQKRRLINEKFLTIAHQKLKADGHLYLATDVQALWEAMIETIQASQKFMMVADDDFWSTHYQTRWKELSLENNRRLFHGTFKIC